jgi:hypothetical protein
MPVLTPLINGTAYSWTNIKVSLFGVPIIGITEVEYERDQKKENNYGFGQNPISRGYGNIENKGSMTLYWDEWIKVVNASPVKDPLAIPPFDVQILFGGSSVNFQQVNLRACEFLKDPFTAKQGDTKFMVKIDLIIALIEHV